MVRIARLFLALGSSRIEDLRAQAVRTSIGMGLIGFFALLTIGFGLAAGTVRLAQRFGLIEACLIMAGGSLVALLVTVVVLQVSRRSYRARARERAELQRRLSNVAMLATFGPQGRPRAGRVVGLGLLAVAVMLIAGRRRGDDDN